MAGRTAVIFRRRSPREPDPRSPQKLGASIIPVKMQGIHQRGTVLLREPREIAPRIESAAVVDQEVSASLMKALASSTGRAPAARAGPQAQ
jgi:hypothetical protein